MLSAEKVSQKPSKVTSIDNFYSKDVIFVRPISKTIEEMLEAELTSLLGHEPYQVIDRKSVNNRIGRYTRKGSVKYFLDIQESPGR